MNSVFRRHWVLTAVAVLVFASASFAQTTSVYLSGVGDSATAWNNGSGVYVDPYTATVGGVQNVSVICDDWANNTYQNESWTANVTTVSSLSLSKQVSSLVPMWANSNGTSYTFTQGQLYDALAYLGSQLLANANNPAAQTNYSFAIWELTNAANLTGSVPITDSSSPSAFIASSGLQPAITSLIVGALQVATSNNPFNAQGWEILTPIVGNSSDPITCNGGNCPVAPPQEFLVYTPESSTVAMLGVDLLGVLALGFFFRRRSLQPVS